VADTEEMERAADGDDLVLGDQALGLGAALLRIALMVGEHQLDLGAAEAGKAGVLRRRQVEIMGIVDDVGCGLERVARVGADLGGRSGQRPDAADQDLLAGLREGARSSQRQRDTGQQDFAAIHRQYSLHKVRTEGGR